MKIVKLTQEKFALVSNEDYERINQFSWCAASDGRGRWYAVRRPKVEEKLGLQVRMHRIILGAPDGTDIDHINGNGLDNQRENLRFCNDRENQQNRRRIKGCSKFKGISPLNGGWRASVRTDKGRIHLGTFRTEEKAALAYDGAAIKHFGVFALTNKQLGLL